MRDPSSTGSSSMPVRLGRSHYERDPEALAAALLGRLLVRTLDDGTRLAGLIVETEAYLGVRDRASHAFGGRRTPRNESMYGPAGTAYVYFTYGMHWCVNVVCGRVGEPAAVLLRALRPAEGLDAMARHRLAGAQRRRRSPPSTPSAPPAAIAPVSLCSGPARLCEALAITGALDGLDLAADLRLFLEPGEPAAPESIERGPRIGVDYAGDWALAPLRFWVRGDPNVSRPRGAVALPRQTSRPPRGARRAAGE